MLVNFSMQIFGDEFWSVKFNIGCSLFEISRYRFVISNIISNGFLFVVLLQFSEFW
jgi:hypothetical protein